MLLKVTMYAIYLPVNDLSPYDIRKQLDADYLENIQNENTSFTNKIANMKRCRGKETRHKANKGN